MKKNKIAFFVVIILTSIALYLHFNNSSSTIKEELRNFAVEDTAAITKIFLADKNGNQVLLEKLKPGHWRANNKYDARNDAIENLLLTIKQLDVKEPVGKSGIENVIKLMSSNSTKVEIYQGDDDKPAKVYYVGHATQDNFGTFMLLENSSVPFVMHIKGFFGYLNTRYFAEEDKWRDSEIFNYELSQMQSLEITHSENPDKSFLITNINSGNPVLKSAGKIVSDLDTALVYSYLSLYNKVNFEEFANEVKKEMRDSITQGNPLFVITITDILGKKNAVKAFRKPTKSGTTDMEGKTVYHDLDRMNALINNGKDFVIIQYFVFDPLTVSYKSFLKKSI